MSNHSTYPSDQLPRSFFSDDLRIEGSYQSWEHVSPWMNGRDYFRARFCDMCKLLGESGRIQNFGPLDLGYHLVGTALLHRKYKKVTMQRFMMWIVIQMLLGFPFQLTATGDAKLSTVAPPNFWQISDTPYPLYLQDGIPFYPILDNSITSYTTYFGFYAIRGSNSFILSIVIVAPDEDSYLKIWSANPENPVSYGASLNFTTEGDLLLHDSDGTMIWSTATKRKSVVGMGLDASGYIVLFDHKNSSVWQSSDYPTDTLIIEQSLHIGMNLSAKPSNTKWQSDRFYLSAESYGLRYSFKPADYEKIIEASTPSTYYKFVSGNLGFPGKIFSLPPAKSLQYLRLESDGHLRLYQMQESRPYILMTYDVLSTQMDFCDYPLACGDYSICIDGQCSCPSISYFKFKNDQYPDAGCTPISSIFCDHMRNHQMIPLDNVSYFSLASTFAPLIRISPSEMICKQSCLMDCSCRLVFFHGYDNGYGNCLLLSEQNEIMFKAEPSYDVSVFLKIQDDPSKSSRISAIIGSTVAGFSLVLIFICAFLWKNLKKYDDKLLDGIPGTPKRFSFEELKLATNQFSVKLGVGGFGSVFKGKIGKETIAVKRLEGVEQGMEEFLAEVMTIGRIHHQSLIRLLGFCAEKSHRLLVYEYLYNGSLDKWIFHTSSVFTLSWKTRHNIILTIAKGLAYLHEECEEKIVHLDIKPQNILLDEKFDAKLSDFGLSKMINKDHSKVMTRMRGTRGYLAPEWLGSTINEKADIYSFGIVMIEIICGRENLDESQPEERIHLISMLQDKARSDQLSDLVDRNSTDMQLHMDEVMQTMKLAMWCLQVDSSRRPLMSTVAKVLEGAMNIEVAPDCTFVPSFAANNTNVEDWSSSYRPSESHLSGPR